ncbi:MAG: YdeI/OmpD-associated family protein [Planctomycetaceae bacterium]|nr:YdeI/OmpD-associated family protein [Planctomycetaceae bacterium]
MSDILTFPDRSAFRKWLDKHGAKSDGVWLLFGKKGGQATLSAHEALEEALCFGWIDGQMQSIDDTCYKKYFARRHAKSKWSEKNKKLAQALIDRGMVAQPGLDAIADAKLRGEWDKPRRAGVDEEQIHLFIARIQQHEQAYHNLLSMPLSVQKTYAGFYYDAKQEQTRHARLAKIIDRLEKNLKPM